jgi:hypothetical protein
MYKFGQTVKVLKPGFYEGTLATVIWEDIDSNNEVTYGVLLWGAPGRPIEHVFDECEITAELLTKKET